ncbi:PA2169 family four-helix-bundle protein [Sphingomonas montanisoli]|uniref:PA2169 family four-helix-bundle protein n=1 Tax=Sphingomonas montanisoli TaxID=2606412 RepID=A0A5D9C3B4_9SPHN|nr:PA2169 family four-helix-bundle protein [Sphingomonas montanisoli]TZG25777.1 PA2169 family four-helix-bundle protein [Sphingomonas montanisoli]
MSSTDYDIRMLNGLIEATLDSAEGYADAASDSSRFAAMFAARSSERRAAAAVLQEHVASLGGSSPDDGTLLAAAHRLFVNLRQTLGGGEVAVVDEVEHGEDHIKAKFEDAVRDSDISSATRAVIVRVQGSVQAGHDAMRQLKHDLHGAT